MPNWVGLLLGLACLMPGCLFGGGGGYGCPRRAEPVDSSHGTADRTLVVHLVNAWDDAPVAGERLVLLVGSSEFGTSWRPLDPAWNDCIVAVAVTNQNGAATFQVEQGRGYHVGHPDRSPLGASKYTEEARVNLPLSLDPIELKVWPRTINLQWNGTLVASNPDGAAEPTFVRTLLVEPERSGLWQRLGFHEATSVLRWNNTQGTYGDLYLGYAAGPWKLLTDDAFNQVQARDDGEVSEDGWAVDSVFADHQCDFEAYGLSGVVFDAGPTMATTAAPLRFTLDLRFNLEGPRRLGHDAPSCALA